MSATLASLRDAYDMASLAYARKFIDELTHKPADREWLQQFALLVGARPVLDLGCGPGHTTAFLTSLGVNATGVDLSPKMIDIASQTFPQSRFEVGDFLSLCHETSSVAGILAFYCIVHLSLGQLATAFSEMHRVLTPGGVLLLSFHIGNERIHVQNFLDTNATLDFSFFAVESVRTNLMTAGFDPVEVHVRAPYATEHPSQRGYVFAHKPTKL